MDDRTENKAAEVVSESIRGATMIAFASFFVFLFGSLSWYFTPWLLDQAHHVGLLLDVNFGDSQALEAGFYNDGIKGMLRFYGEFAIRSSVGVFAGICLLLTVSPFYKEG
ncbi:TPA: hypothetical protein ACUNF5_005271 [Burkholderia orbicola]